MSRDSIVNLLHVTFVSFIATSAGYLQNESNRMRRKQRIGDVDTLLLVGTTRNEPCSSRISRARAQRIFSSQPFPPRPSMAATPPHISWLPVAEIDLNGTCTQLYFGNRIIHSLGINPLQLALLCTTIAFLLFLVIRIPCSVSRMNKRPNSISKIYYTVVWCASLLCCTRILLSWFVWKETSVGSEIVWIGTSTLFWGIEVSVFVFLFSSDVSSARQLVKRVAVITFACMIVFAGIQSVVVFVAQIRIYEYTPLSLYWWAPFNAMRTISYIIILLLPFFPCQRLVVLPTRKTFYAYIVLLALVHIGELVGTALIFGNQRSVGYCFVDASLIAYFSLYCPFLYLMFLREYFHTSTDMPEQMIEYDDYAYEPIN